MLCREFDGALILVSHDRSFMNEVCNQILGFPEMILYEGYDQWAKAREKTRSQLFQANKKAAQEAARETAMTLKSDASLEISKNAPKPKKKLSFNEKRELEQMESRIQDQESLIEQIQKQLEDPSMMSHAIKLTELTLALSEAEKERDRLYQRWEELDQIQANL
jgi:ATP-binding cassette subfamily F protein uup